MRKIEIGERFGSLVVIEEVPRDQRPSQNGRYYLCQCDCGNTKIVYGHNLKTGNTKSCGCLSRKTASNGNSVDMPIGSKYGKLTVLSRAPVRPGGRAMWTCRCDCGNIVEVAGVQLRNGKIHSCGCEKYNRLIDETGNRYGNLMVIEYAGSIDGGGALWKCKCDCGNIIQVRGQSLRSGHTRSCGCIKSWKEKEIAELLSQYGLSFQTQYTFDNLRTKVGGALKFDFAIFDNGSLKYLIEYQGDQHYDSENAWYSEDYCARDWLKKAYCIDNNIELKLWNKNSNLEQEIVQIAEVMKNEHRYA